MNTSPVSQNKTIPLILLGLVILAGAWLRIHSDEPYWGIGVDEKFYSRYVEQITKVGVWNYPDIIDLYIEDQLREELAFIPPTRISFLICAAAWQSLFHTSTLGAVHAISCGSSILLLAFSAVFAWRLGGSRASVLITTLMAFAPTQIFMAHRALIDGFFSLTAFLVLWFLWECLQNSASRRWFWAFGCSLCLMVTTKENAAFVYAAVLGILAANHWLRLGKITKPLLAATLLGPMLGAALLVLCAGGVGPLFEAFQLNIRKSLDLPYAAATGDGPWFRYLSDLLLISPAIIPFAIGGAFLTRRKDKLSLYFILFIGISFFIMGHLRYGMNVRYANMWDFPLRWLAVVPLILWSEQITQVKRRHLFLGTALLLLTASELLSYRRIFVRSSIYDPIPYNLMKALDMVKTK